MPALSAYAAERGLLAGEALTAAAAQDTGVDGRFALGAAGIGPFKILVRAQGRAPMEFGPFMLTRPRELPAVTLPKAVATAIQVLHESGEPAAGAWVVAVPAREERPLTFGPTWKLRERVGQTDATGTALLPRLDGERLEVSVLAPGWPPLRRPVASAGVIQLARPAGIQASFRVSQATGEPAAGVLLRIDGHPVPVGLSDAGGALPALSPTRLPVAAELLAAGAPPQPVALPGPGSEAISIQLAAPTTARGRVLDAVTGRGLAGALVAPSADLGAAIRTGAQGRFSLPVPSTHDWTYEAHAPGYLPTRLTVAASQLATGRLPALALEPAAEIAGRALDAEGRPLAAVSIEAVPESSLGAHQHAATDPVSDRGVSKADGTFLLQGLRAASRYELRGRKAGLLPAAILVPTAPHGQRSAAVELRLLAARSALGRVVDPDGRPLAGARVVLRPARRVGRRNGLRGRVPP